MSFYVRQEAADLEAATLSAAGKGKGKGRGTVAAAAAAASAVGGAGLAWATELATLEMEEAANDERHLRKARCTVEAGSRNLHVVRICWRTFTRTLHRSIEFYVEVLLVCCCPSSQSYE